jgi:hypothetical protein
MKSFDFLFGQQMDLNLILQQKDTTPLHIICIRKFKNPIKRCLNKLGAIFDYGIKLAIMKNELNRKFSVQLSFEEIRLPPFEDILILGKKCPQGRIGVYRSFEYLVPNEFETFEIEDETVEAIFINKKVLRKMDEERIIEILRKKVFPFISEYEILKVDFKLRIFYDSVEGEF